MAKVGSSFARTSPDAKGQEDLSSGRVTKVPLCALTSWTTVGGTGNVTTRAYHQQEVESAANHIKTRVLQPEEVQVLPAKPGRLLRAGVGSCTAEFPTASWTPGAPAL